jgi:hypothetical protein
MDSRPDRAKTQLHRAVQVEIALAPSWFQIVPIANEADYRLSVGFPVPGRTGVATSVTAAGEKALFRQIEPSALDWYLQLPISGVFPDGVSHFEDWMIRICFWLEGGDASRGSLR